MGMKTSQAPQWAASTFLIKCSIPRSAQKKINHKCLLSAIITSVRVYRDSQHLLLLTPGEVLLSVHLADGSAVVFHLTDPLLRSSELVLQVLLHEGIIYLQPISSESPQSLCLKVNKTKDHNILYASTE